MFLSEDARKQGSLTRDRMKKERRRKIGGWDDGDAVNLP
jgi:hypothetical protein